MRDCTHSYWNAIIYPLSKRIKRCSDKLFLFFSNELPNGCRVWQKVEKLLTTNFMLAWLLVAPPQSPLPRRNFILVLVCVFCCCHLPCWVKILSLLTFYKITWHQIHTLYFNNSVFIKHTTQTYYALATAHKGLFLL